VTSEVHWSQEKSSGDKLVDLISENVDRLINLDLSSYGVIRHLHEAAFELYGRPVTLEAAERLKNAIGDNEFFFVTSGWVMPGYYPYGETDGPIGAATIGRALAVGLNARMVVLTEETMIGVTTAACRAAGLNVMTEEDLRRAPRPPHRQNHYCVVVPFPIDEVAAVSEAKRLFDAYSPKALIAIEKNGPNKDGRYSMVNGSDNSDCVAKAAKLFDEAKKRKVLTIGIGDRGNEIGLGTIAEVPRRILPYGEKATDSTIVDVVVTAAISNWGASGIAAVLAAILNKPDVLHDTSTETRMLHRCIEAGGVDGFNCCPVPITDGMSESTQVAICALLNELVMASAARKPSVFATPLLKKPSN
jgi:hypothetical protein